jgi:hypothetical protein
MLIESEASGILPPLKDDMKKILACLFLAMALLAAPAARALPLSNSAPSLFTTEQAAQQHCPSDKVVWLDLKTGTYHLKGQLLYGKQRNGSYVCRQEALLSGAQPSRNGQ